MNKRTSTRGDFNSQRDILTRNRNRLTELQR